MTGSAIAGRITPGSAGAQLEVFAREMRFRRRHRQEHVPDRRLVRPVLGGNLAIQQFPG